MIRLENIVKTYSNGGSDFNAVDGVTLDIADGQLLSVAKSVAESDHCSCRKGDSDKKSDGTGSLLGGLTAVGLTLDIVDSLIMSAVGRLKHGDRK